MYRFPSFLCATLLLASLSLSGAQRTAAQEPDAPNELGRSDFVGMAIRDPYYEWGSDSALPDQPNRAFQDQMGVLLERAGVTWVRFEFHVRSADIDAELAKHDYFINEVAPRHGLKVLALLAFDLVPGRTMWELNCTKIDEPGRCVLKSSETKYGGGVNHYMNDWLDHALRIADRYGASIAAYEVLNEENRLPPSGLGIAPTMTGRLLTKFYRFCHGIESGEAAHGCDTAKIILGGIHPRGTSDTKKPSTIAQTDAQYLTSIYTDTASFAGFKSNPAHPYYPLDGVAYHPYPEEIRLSPNQAQVDKGMERMRAVLNQYDALQQFWITEIGYNVAFYRNTERDLEPFVRDVFSSLAARELPGGLPEVANTFWFKYEDFAPADGKDAQKWGMVRIPFQADATRPDGTRYSATGLPIMVRGTYTVLRELTGMPADPPRVFLPLLGS